ncbi:hypothetical protein GIB67_028966 [Kingdonia uniflora]|uniref:Pentatricopeptide repeat-containing protein n=1 Tax=Kingdonia uniflora TaxID=39325 RepID=A0A7J7LCA0_9MAGN|nr:hypothetical protein GIB67_028966 [Kingdonia uniflora]
MDLDFPIAGIEIKPADHDAVKWARLDRKALVTVWLALSSQILHMISKVTTMKDLIELYPLCTWTFRDGRVCRAMELVNYMDCRGFELNVVACNALIGGYVDLKDMEGVSRVLKLMSKRRITNDVVTYTLLIKGFCKLGRVSEAEKVLRGMIEKTSLVVDEHVYGVLVDRDMGARCLKLDSYSYNTLVDVFCKEDRVSAFDDAMHHFHLMLKRGVSPDEVTCSTLLDGFFKMEDFEEALKLWKTILTRGFVKIKVTFNVMINGLCKFVKMVKAEEILCKMKELGCFPDGVTYQSDGYSSLGDVEKALDVKGKMEMEEISTYAEMYNSLIGEVFKCKRSSKVNDLLIEMHASGLKPNVVTYGALIDGWCKDGMFGKAFHMFFEMIEKGLTPNLIIFSTMLSSLYRIGRLDDAFLIMQKMKIVDSLDGTVNRYLLPDNIVYNIAIAGLCKSKKVEDARQFFSALLLQGFVLDNFTYCTLIHGCSFAGDVNEAFNLRDEMLSKGLVYNIITCNALINSLCKSGYLDRAAGLFYKLKKELAPNVVTYNTLIDGYPRSS